MNKLIDYDSTSILNEFQNQYSSAFGSKMLPGSEEFAISSVFSYTIATLVNSMNRAALNRFIDTAKGQWLDAIATTFGLSRVAEPKLNAHFAVCYAGGEQTMLNMPKENVIIEGINYHRKTYQHITNEGGLTKNVYLDIYIADKPLNREPLTHDALQAAVIEYAPEMYRDDIEVIGVEYPKGIVAVDGVSQAFPYTDEGDAAFREYIKSNSNIISGTARYYEELYRGLHPSVSQVYCIRHSDYLYVKGLVKLYYLLEPSYGEKTFMNQDSNYFKLDVNTVYNRIVQNLFSELAEDDRYITIGAQIALYEPITKAIYPTVKACYSSSFMEAIEGSQTWAPLHHLGTWTSAQAHYFIVYIYYMHLMRHLRMTYNTSELSALLMKPLNEIEGLESWVNSGVNIFGNPGSIVKMFKAAQTVSAKLTYRVSDLDGVTPVEDYEWTQTNAQFYYFEPSLKTSVHMGSVAVEKALVCEV